MIDSHQDRDEAVALQLQVKIGGAEYMSFYTIVTDHKWPLSADIAHVDDAAHIKVVKYGVSSTLKLTLIIPHTRP